jgi:hypothetical protein
MTVRKWYVETDGHTAYGRIERRTVEASYHPWRYFNMDWRTIRKPYPETDGNCKADPRQSPHRPGDKMAGLPLFCIDVSLLAKAEPGQG